MTVVLDSSVLIDLLRDRDGPARDYLASLDKRPFCSEITRVEVLRGLRSAERGPAERMFDALNWVPVSEPIARLAGALGRDWRRSHPGISTADLIVAGTAGQLNLAVATANVKHFPMFKGLRPPY